ncbi:MAG: hypothetical protein IPJ86_06220 [Bacteroidetes bacterium]|nr:hypothetical protein [Bacteroidota bacterium]
MLAQVHIQIGRTHAQEFDKKANAIAKLHYDSAITFAMRIDDMKLQGKATLLTGALYQVNDRKTSLRYYRTALNYYEQIGDNEGIAKTNERIGQLLFGVKAEASLYHFKIAYENYIF